MDAKEWSTRRIMIERGTITWTADSICKNVGVVDQVREFFGHEKVFSLEFPDTASGGGYCGTLQWHGLH